MVRSPVVYKNVMKLCCNSENEIIKRNRSCLHRDYWL